MLGKTVMSDFKVSQQLARKQHQEANERRRQDLLPVARALRDPRLAGEVIASARRQVSLWRSRKLCSRDYIEAWEALLSKPEQAAEVLEDKSPIAEQLRQNSPFVASVRKFRVARAA